MGSSLSRRQLSAWTLILCGVGPLYTAADDDRPSEAEVAAAVDDAIHRVLAESGVEIAPPANDDDFLRRAYLDLAGTIPTPGEVTLFGLDASPDKRTAMIEQLLESDGFAANWGAYFREVFLARATDMRARLSQTSFETWLTEQFAENRPWDETTRAILTASGTVTEEGPTAFMFAHFGDASELAGETSRIFLGIQISCANCHDHPYDSWKREQFHELAAFFPRVQVRQEMGDDRRTFVVVSNNAQRGGGQGLRSISRVYQSLDVNRDGQLTREEAAAQERVPVERLFQLGDTDNDGMLSMMEAEEIQPPSQPGRGTPEHYMPDLENPEAQGTQMEPIFFVNGESAEVGDDDLVRREQLADFITSPDNPWFAKAFVNRIWAEMLGQGFYPLVDDLGPEREPVHAEVLELLSQGFIDSGYDVKWLFRTIALTEAYQREMRHRDPSDSSPPFAAAAPTRLRSDQLYNALVQVFGTNEFTARNVPRRQFGMYGADVDVGRIAFAQLFGFDPSTPQADLLGTIPQALMLMNGRLVENLIASGRNTRLSQLLDEFDNDDDALEELYLLVLSRQPTSEELTICQAHIEAVGDRGEAFEDIFWSILNSTEFLTKR